MRQGPDRTVLTIADVESVAEKKRRIEAEQLRELMEAKWQAPGVLNARRFCKWVKPMRLGSTYGYQDDLCSE